MTTSTTPPTIHDVARMAGVSVTTVSRQKANNSAYGLAAGVWTDKGSRAFDITNRLRAGVVWQNTFNRFGPTAAFGGFKESGFGREGGPAGLLPYLVMA